jgi:hypothetical protein
MNSGVFPKFFIIPQKSRNFGIVKRFTSEKGFHSTGKSVPTAPPALSLPVDGEGWGGGDGAEVG